MENKRRFKLLGLLVVLAVASLFVLPSQTASAAKLTKVAISPDENFLVAGYKYTMDMETNKLKSTRWNSYIMYKSNIATGRWNLASSKQFDFDSPKNNSMTFSIPEDYDNSQVYLKVEAWFTPKILAFNSDDYKILGPFRVRNMRDITNLEAKANSDGTVTLSWDTTTDMARYYEIVRTSEAGERTMLAAHQRYLLRQEFTDESTLAVDDEEFVYHVKPILDQRYISDMRIYDTFQYISRRVTAPKPRTVTIYPLPVVGDFVLFEGSGASDPGDEDADVGKDKDGDEVPRGLRDLVIQGRIDRGFGLEPSFRNLLAGGTQGVAVEKVELDKKELALVVGETATLKATVSPSNAADKSVSWRSSNEAVATVDDNGQITAHAGGTTNIRVITQDGGKTDLAVVTVEADEEEPLPDGEGAPQPPLEGDEADADSKEPGETDFSDIPAGYWAEDEIIAAVEVGLVEGYPDGTFRPTGDVTRAEFATMLMRGMPKVANAQPLTFQDNDEIGEWAAEHVQQAVAQGIIEGYPDGTFRPDANIDHAEMITMVVRAAELAVATGQQTSFADDAHIPDWAKDNVAAAQQAGIIFGGITDNRFNAGANTIRAESASSIIRMLQLP